MKNLIILVVAHKPFAPEVTHQPYKTIFVGSKKFVPKNKLVDNTGDNIANKNNSYCELTAMYWAWKNLKCNIIGINHYRRYFAEPGSAHKKQINLNSVLTEETVRKILKKYDIIVPKKKVVPSLNIKTHYISHHYKKDLDITRNIIQQSFPDYLRSFDKVMKQHSMYICNMAITSKTIYDQYCTWLFDVLKKVESMIDIEGYSVTQTRVFGFLAERLFNVWLETHKDLSTYQLNILSLERKSFTPKEVCKKISRRIRRKKL